MKYAIIQNHNDVYDVYGNGRWEGALANQANAQLFIAAKRAEVDQNVVVARLMSLVEPIIDACYDEYVAHGYDRPTPVTDTAVTDLRKAISDALCGKAANQAQAQPGERREESHENIPKNGRDDLGHAVQ